MSAIANKIIVRAITTVGTVTNINCAGVSNTDHKQETWTPVGIDANGVAKFRAPLSGDQTLADAGILTHSQTTPYGEVGKTTNKDMLVIPYTVTEQGLSVRRTAKANISIDLYNSMSSAQTQDFYNALISAIHALQTDIVARSPMY